MIELRRFLHSSTQTRSALKALIPARYHDHMRRWLLRPKAEVQWCRVVMNREVERFIRSLDCSHIDALEISGSGSQGRFGFRSYRGTQYPDYDICEGHWLRSNSILLSQSRFSSTFSDRIEPQRTCTRCCGPEVSL